jgi:hypothetical protein
MPYILTAPFTLEIHEHEIESFNFDIENNLLTIKIVHRDKDGFDIKRDSCEFPIVDASGNVLMPPDSPPEYPSGEQLYGMMKIALYGRLRELPGMIGNGVLV